jgi:hypothetical protein
VQKTKTAPGAPKPHIRHGAHFGPNNPLDHLLTLYCLQLRLRTRENPPTGSYEDADAHAGVIVQASTRTDAFLALYS